MKANERQVGGDHYKMGEHEEHWDRAWRLKWDPFQYQITKYVERWKDKNGVEDLEKALHFLQKYIEVIKAQPATKAELKSELEIMLQVPPTLLYEGGSKAEDYWQCRVCRLHMRSPRGELPSHNNNDCLAAQNAGRTPPQTVG